MAMLNNQRVYANSDLITGNKKNDQYTCLFFAAEIGTISPVKI
jgi:hypothetical protein